MVWPAGTIVYHPDQGTLGQLSAAFEACVGNAECEAAFGPLAFCGYPFHPGECTPGFQDLTRPDWIFTGVAGVPAMDLGTADFRWGGVVIGGGAFDPSRERQHCGLHDSVAFRSPA